MPLPEGLVRPGAAKTALWLGASLLLITSLCLGDAPSSPRCPEPREVASADGWTTEVTCVRGPGLERDVRGPVRLLFGLTLDLNRADPKALEVLPRIGPSRAAAIVRAREKAAFTSVDDLTRVRGIGPKTVRGLAGWVGVGNPE